jgi:hypothetical protein
MILEAVPAQPPERPNGQQAINQTSRHYAEALPNQVPKLHLYWWVALELNQRN